MTVHQHEEIMFTEHHLCGVIDVISEHMIEVYFHVEYVCWFNSLRWEKVAFFFSLSE